MILEQIFNVSHGGTLECLKIVNELSPFVYFASFEMPFYLFLHFKGFRSIHVCLSCVTQDSTP